MKLDPGMHIGMHLVFFGKSGVTAAGDGRRAGRATSRRATLWPKLFYWCCLCNRIAPKFCIKVDQVMNTKVADLATLNNFFKGYTGFFLTEFELFECQL
jgi:hypothetical protein